MTGWTVMLRGLRYRAGRSAVVALLAMVAVAAAVLAPGFSRAAQQSVLTDGLSAAPAASNGLVVAAGGTAEGAPAAHELTGEARLVVDAALARHPVLGGALGESVGGADTDTVVTGGSEPLAARFAYRDTICDQLTIAGDCPIDAGQVLVSARTADGYGIAPGDLLTIELDNTSLEVEVVGTYAPADPTEPYWGRTAYFTQGGFDQRSGAPRVDAVFTGAETDVQADPAGEVNLGLTYPLRPGAVRLGDVPVLRADLRALDGAVRVAGLELTTALPAILDDAAADQEAIGRTAPIIAVPLVLLAWFVLFLLVAALTEERGREIALAKLRGFPSGRAARFGLGEVLVLIVAAAPFGVALGLGAVEAAARLVLAEGTHAELRWPVLVAAAAALGAATLAAFVAGRATLRRGVLALLRRVPERTGWRAGVADGVVVALAGASLVAALGDRSSPLALLAPALLALVAGIAAARLVRLWSGLRLRLARRRGRIPGLLSAAQLSRRPGAQRLIVVVTVAVALLSFAATAWDVAAQARHDHATDALGADRVYTVAADHPAALIDAVHRADPDGTSMAVVRAGQQYAGEQVELLAVEAQRLPKVAVWRGQDRASVAATAGALRPPVAQPLRVSDRIEVTAQVSDLEEDPVRLSALVSAPGEPPRAVSLGTLSEGSQRYAAAVAGCSSGCRLLGLGLSRAGTSGAYAATVEVRAIRADGEQLAARLDEPDAWLVPESQSTVSVAPGPVDSGGGESGLMIEVAAGHTGHVAVEHQDTVAALPAVLAGPAPAEDPGATDFGFIGFAERPEPFSVVDRASRLPRAGERGLLFDLEYAVRSAERTVALSDSGALRYEVWASDRAPAVLSHKLAAGGVSVLRTESFDGTLDQLSRRAPALALWLYLLAAGAAVALAVGMVALSTRIGVTGRLHELAALRVSGVSPGLLRRGVLREYLTLVGGPLVVGLVVGVAAALLMLPGIPLVEVGTLTPVVSYRPALGALPVGVAVTAGGLLLVALRALRLPRRATLDRLQGASQ